jgi:hypothetical protein
VSRSDASSDPAEEVGLGLVEEYLDKLLVQLPGSPREVRHLLAEAEAHLRDATADGIGRGQSAEDAEREAVARFGSAGGLARQERLRQSVPAVMLARQCVLSALFLGGIGGLAVGVSGALTAVLGAIGGSRFIVDISPARHLATSDCARWLAANPGAHSCYQAALSAWALDTILIRGAVGVLGALSIAAFLVLRRRSPGPRASSLPAAVVDTVALTLFAIAGIWLLGLGVDAIVVASGHGAGQWLGAAPVALASAGFFGFRLLLQLRHVPAA